MYDIIYTGGGLSALLSAYYITRKSKLRLSILFVELLENPLIHKTISYWNNDNCFPDEIIRKSWNEIAFISDETRVFTLKNGSYNTISGEKLENWLKAEIALLSDARYLRERVIGKFENNESAWITTTKGRYTGKFIFDSIVDKELLASKVTNKKTPHMSQYFLGVEIMCEKPVFDERKMIFSDFSISNSNSYEFAYILPYSNNNGLIELVSDRPVPKEKLVKYIESVCGEVQYKTTYKEEGNSFLTCHCEPRKIGKRIISIGNAAGMLKPSTGYAFNNIVRDSKYIAENFDIEDGIRKTPHKNIIYKVFDRMFVVVISNKPELAKPIFTRLFTKCHIEDILGFLDEKITAAGFIRVTSTMFICGWQYILVSLRLSLKSLITKLQIPASTDQRSPVFPR